ncbi:hypothetical protein IMZ48_25070, partial [Candidatus Bathyarchaeota archaeon]|nr:hypothetical protein [Candidatus Bathyarchaeota archaeon]
MHSFTLAAICALATLATAETGRAIVNNNCDFPVYVWSVGSEVSYGGEIATGKSFTEDLVRDPVTGGLAIKVTTVEDGLYNGAPQTNFAYTLDPEQVWYDLSDVFGSPFDGHAVVLEPTDEDCDSIV